jgi:hypothetical protein
MRRLAALLLLSTVALLIVPAGAAASGAGHYLPRAGDRFAYAETIDVTNGQGNYTGYTDEGDYTGSIAVTNVLANGTVNATYQASGPYHNSMGQQYSWQESGAFSFSPATFHYVAGTDNQTGYVDPYVWFYVNASLGRGATFYLLNTEMTVVATSDPFPTTAGSTGYVATIFAEGNGSYQRNDGYGKFSASYNWKAYFDPTTGYLVGYVYTETDSDAAGDGFTYTDTLTDTQTSFALTSVPPPPGPTSSSSSAFPWLYVVVGVVLVVIVIGIVIALALRARRTHPSLPRHPTGPAGGTMPAYAAPPAINLIPRDQPAVQQVVVKETVKVPCRYCGTLIDSTATVCPQCGASRA